MAVLVTRSAPDNLRTARALHALGLDPMLVPAITTMAIHQQPIASVPDAIIFTSVHAIRHFAGHAQMLGVPVIVASGVVAEAALAAGYATVTSIGNEDLLIPMLGHLLRPSAHVLIVCGVTTSMTLAHRVLARAYRVERRIVYRPVPSSSDEIERLTQHLGRTTAIVLHSCVGAQRIVPVLQAAQWQGSLWCISAKAAQACSDLRGVSIAAAAEPSEAALLDMIARLTPGLVRRRSNPLRNHGAAVMSPLLDRSSRKRRRAGTLADNDNAPEPDREDPGTSPRAT